MKYLITLVLTFAALQVISCGKSDEQVAKERADNVMVVRKGIYDVATAALKKQLNSPSTAKFAAVTAENTDTASLFVRGDSALVHGEYDAQNGFGTYLHDKFQVRLLRVNGTWICRKPEYPSMDVRTGYSGKVLKEPDWNSEWSAFPTLHATDQSLKVDTSKK